MNRNDEARKAMGEGRNQQSYIIKEDCLQQRGLGSATRACSAWRRQDTKKERPEPLLFRLR